MAGREPITGAQSPGQSTPTSVADAFFTALAHASGDVDQDLPVLLQVIAECLGFEVATMWWWKAEEGVLRCEHVWQAPAAECAAFLELALRSALAPGEPVPGVVFRDGAPAWVPDVKSYPSFRRGPAASAAGLRSGVAFPIRARHDIVGVFELFTLEQRDLDAPLLDAVANAAAHLGDFIERLNVHAERDRLLGELHAAHRRQRFLLDANRALSTTKGLRETIDKLARVAVPAIGDLCLIDVVTKSGGIERLSAYHTDQSLGLVVDELRRFPPLPDGDHPAAIAIRSGTSQIGYEMPRRFLSSTTQSPRHYELTQQLHFTSYVSAPLHSGQRPVGALTVVSAGSGRHFGHEELQLVEELAAQVSSVIERERRFDEQRHIALILQRSMLPEAVEAPEGLDVSARYFASSHETEIGGDFYDLVHLGASRVALVVGDVQGHDLTAITVMAKVRNALRAFFQTMHGLDEVLRAVDCFVSAQPEQRFVTLAIAVLDVPTGAVEVALAGHPAPLKLGAKVEALTCHPGPPIGVAHRLGHNGYQTVRSHLPVGAGLVFYTDGLIEARQGGPEARLHRLLQALDRHRHAPLERACDAVIAETLAGITPPDDVAVLWAVRTGAEKGRGKPSAPSASTT
ncbi:MAG TPA: SpoIIE family protein phosphatase [Acidimicrobiales bacterium]|nr:SpoIIE family protein phosphatase [Acidimicrobiales bacterium]